MSEREAHAPDGGRPTALRRAPSPAHGRIVEPDFVPARGLANAHLQTVWAAYRRPVPDLPLAVETVAMPDGDLVRVARPRSAPGPQAPPVLLLHGLNGSRRSRYIRGMMAALLAGGYEPIVLEFRGVDRGPVRTPRSYHAGFTEDLDVLARRFAHEVPGRPMAAVGFSLGGNVLLQWLAERGGDAPVRWAAAVSVPFDLAAAGRALDRGAGRVYRTVLLGELRRTAARRAARCGHPSLAPDDILHLRSFYEFDDRYIAPLFGFRNAADYYARSSSGPRLGRIRVPVLLVSAEDDPLVPAATLPRATDLAPETVFFRTRRGGHVGFIEDGPTGRRAWSERAILRELGRHIPPAPETRTQA